MTVSRLRLKRLIELLGRVILADRGWLAPPTM